jgi:hypothetical protein
MEFLAGLRHDVFLLAVLQHNLDFLPLLADLADLAERLGAVKGRIFLWDRYAEESKAYRTGKTNKAEFTPSMLYWIIADIFPEYRDGVPRSLPDHRARPPTPWDQAHRRRHGEHRQDRRGHRHPPRHGPRVAVSRQR